MFHITDLQLKRSCCCLSVVKGPKRFYSHQLPTGAHGEPFFHKEWPQHKNPTPYEVLGFYNNVNIDSALLKKKYYQLAKLYHPDTGVNKLIVSHTGATLTEEHKSERFKMLTDAYSLLKDHKKRALYDQFKTGWNGVSTTAPTWRTDQQPSSYNYQDQRYWNASTWEDYQNLRDMNDPALRQDKLKALAGIILFMISGAAIQGWFFLNNMESTLIARQEVHDTCEAHLMSAYLNYGLDTSRVGRIKRFLWFRTFGMYKTTEGLNEGAKKDEQLLKEIMQAKPVQEASLA
ncbi:Jid1p [Cyberlindnera jadinii NRRL Y-1542]|uniref:DnaJ-domain-containing protein n=1 Tax=Cyberlindnera jadinii (strain ATCC 18201 / CBS 1600 / BCRC 20928 / JCM 3617 / NBRC 0987 / NRRL Y-1542) TaxID=983966 RepID=A0A1E4S1Z9_CYBJN|nr:DnaJ-domain-containing protein [Cyberlindnera jadinii NRRL Y-1542]ODV73527.1 DnaJ-domain-containing protein [Cyberlindnera jadinii NRRL Y-1542]